MKILDKIKYQKSINADITLKPNYGIQAYIKKYQEIFDCKFREENGRYNYCNLASIPAIEYFKLKNEMVDSIVEKWIKGYENKNKHHIPVSQLLSSDEPNIIICKYPIICSMFEDVLKLTEVYPQEGKYSSSLQLYSKELKDARFSHIRELFDVYDKLLLKSDYQNTKPILTGKDTDFYKSNMKEYGISGLEGCGVVAGYQVYKCLYEILTNLSIDELFELAFELKFSATRADINIADIIKDDDLVSKVEYLMEYNPTDISE